MNIPPAVQSLGRFQILDQNRLIAPGKCAGCGGFTGRHFVDFGLELDFYGVVYLCLEYCFTEVANQIGFASPDQVESLKARIDSYKGHTDVLQGKLSALENVSYAMASYLRIDPLLTSNSSDSGTVHQDSGSEGTKVEGQPNPGIETGQSGSAESIDVNGPTGILDDDSLDEFTKQFDI